MTTRTVTIKSGGRRRSRRGAKGRVIVDDYIGGVLQAGGVAQILYTSMSFAPLLGDRPYRVQKVEFHVGTMTSEWTQVCQADLFNTPGLGTGSADTVDVVATSGPRLVGPCPSRFTIHNPNQVWAQQGSATSKIATIQNDCSVKGDTAKIRWFCRVFVELGPEVWKAACPTSLGEIPSQPKTV